MMLKSGSIDPASFVKESDRISLRLNMAFSSEKKLLNSSKAFPSIPNILSTGCSYDGYVIEPVYPFTFNPAIDSLVLFIPLSMRLRLELSS